MTSTGYRSALVAIPVAMLLAACATPEPVIEAPRFSPAQVRAAIAERLPAQLADRSGWVTDIAVAFNALQIAPTPSNVCAVVAITEQESSFRADPAVPGLGAIAWREIEKRAERAGVPMFVVRTALQLGSSNGVSDAERIDKATTERELSEVFEDIVGRVPLGSSLFSGWNPVRTGGPMQVSIGFAEQQVRSRPYPYPLDRGVRHEVFTRRGGLYFGIAHLLAYAADYDRPLYRFADFNAGRYASRNAALQKAISLASAIPLVADGDLVRHDGSSQAGSTESAARVLGGRLGMNEAAIRRDLEQGEGPELARTTLYRRVFELADRTAGRPVPRAAVPEIELRGPKISRKLTTAWFAGRVDERHRRCLARADG